MKKATQQATSTNLDQLNEWVDSKNFLICLHISRSHLYAFHTINLYFVLNTRVNILTINTVACFWIEFLSTRIFSCFVHHYWIFQIARNPNCSRPNPYYSLYTQDIYQRSIFTYVHDVSWCEKSRHLFCSAEDDLSIFPMRILIL